MGRIAITFNRKALTDHVGMPSKKLLEALRARLPPDDQIEDKNEQIVLTVPVRLRLRGGIKRVEGWDQADWTTPTERHDEALIKALAQAHEWRELIERGEVLTLEDIVERTKHDRSHVRRILKLAFLAPDIQRAILTGRQPKSLTLAALADIDLPLHWQSQRTLLSVTAV